MSRVNIAGYNVSANPTAPNSLFDNGGGGGSFDPSDYLSNITITESGATVTFTGIDGDGGSRVLGTITIPDGSDGITFTPHITQITGGYRLSWTNDGGAENPDPVDILNGAAGAKGDKGDTGDDGTTFTPSITEITGGHRLSWTNDGGKANPNPVDIMDGADGAIGPQGPAGAAGQGVPAGGTTGQVLTKSSNDNYDTAWITPSHGTTAFDIEEVSDISQATFCGADIRIGTAPAGGASIPITNGYRVSFLNAQLNYTQNTEADPTALTVNLYNEAIPVGGTRRRFTSDTLWRSSGKCFAFDLGGRITSFTAGPAGSAQGAFMRETGVLKYLVGAQTGGYLIGGIATGSNGWLVTWGEGDADISAFNITVTNVKYYKVVEVTP